MLKKLSVLLFVLSLSACSLSPPVSQTQSEWQQHLSQLQKMNDWQLRGKVAFISESKRQAANLFWQQQGENSQMRLTGPLGIDILELRFSENSVWLRDKDGNEYSGDDPQQLIARLSGWQIPVLELGQWLRGIPSSNDYQLSEQHRLASASNQQGWQVNYLNYADYPPYVLPRQLEFVHSATKLKLNIYDWQING